MTLASYKSIWTVIIFPLGLPQVLKNTTEIGYKLSAIVALIERQSTTCT